MSKASIILVLALWLLFVITGVVVAADGGGIQPMRLNHRVHLMADGGGIQP